MQLAVPGVSEQGSRDLVVLEYVLQANKEGGQALRRNRKIFNKGQRPGCALEPIEGRHDVPSQPPKQLHIVRLHRRLSVKRHPLLPCELADDLLQTITHLARIVTGELDKQHCFGRARDQQFKGHFALASDRQQTAIHQVASADAHPSHGL